MTKLFPEMTPSEIILELQKLNLSPELKNFVDSAFRVRVKFREVTKQMTLQLRCRPPMNYDDGLDLEEQRIILQDLVKDSGIDFIVLDYTECCNTGCQGCGSYGQ